MKPPLPLRSLLVMLALLAGVLAGAPAALAQGDPAAPASYEILGLSVEGATSEATRQFVLTTSGLRVGQRITLPGDQAVAEAVRRLYELGNFTGVDVLAERFVGEGVFLLVLVEEAARVGSYRFEGVSRGEADELRRKVPLLRGRPLREADLARSRQVIERYFEEKGYRLTEVEIEQHPAGEDRVEIAFHIRKGQRVKVGDVRFAGNEAFSEATLRRQLKNTKEKRWWRFWGGERFDPRKFEEDKESLLAFYNDRGYYSARILSDTVYLDTSGGSPDLVVQIALEEGPRYHIREIAFEGNTEYTDEQLRQALGIAPGELYNRSRLERNLYYNPEHTDVTSLYSDRGYLRFRIEPKIIEAAEDSLDIVFEISEGEVYTFGQVGIAGNTRTKDHVIRRELRTIPGQTYSRQAIERSIRELMQLSYFDPQRLAEGPGVAIDEEQKTVELTYRLVETGGDQLELSGGWGGAGYGLILQARVAFNNFSIQNVFNGRAWRPVPMGDGQQLALSVQTSGRRYQSYGLSFTEPWFRGRRTPAGFALSYTRRDFTLRGALGLEDLSEEADARNAFSSLAGRIFYRQALRWPDDFFQTGTDLSYRLYDVAGQSFSRAYGLPLGRSQELTIRQSLTRNSFDNPLFPRVGSSLLISAEIAPPIPGFIQYHKERFTTTWVTPIVGNLALQFSGDFGYVGSLTGEDVEFQRFLVGGSPLDVQGGYLGYGKDLLFMRGYPLGAISPREGGRLVGGRILNKYSLEARVLAIQSPQFQVAPYAFLDAANVWDGFSDYNPGRLYRSAGLGAKLFIPILGMVDLNYGYQIDSFIDTAPASSRIVEPQWRFQFSLGG